jgi:hypothetical protein
MKPQTDSAGNTFYEVGNVRITCIKQTWDNGKPGLRIQTYKGAGRALHQGAEIPIPDAATAYEFVKAIMKVFELLGL